MKNLSKVAWSDNLNIGNSIIDSQHSELFAIIKEMNESILKGDITKKFAVLLSRMTDYSIRHFTSEEQYMSEIGYPDIENHQKLHKEYVLKTAIFNSQYLTLTPPDSDEVIIFLTHWWANHIRQIDTDYIIFRKNEIYEEIVKLLKSESTEDVKISGQRFFKESVNILGVKSQIVEKISKMVYSKLIDKNKILVFDICEKLWQSGIMEESFVACSWAYNQRKSFKESDFSLFEKWIETYITNWASCDTFCNHTMGAFIDMYPDHLNNLKKWTGSSNRWMRRAAAVSLIIPAREGRYKDDIFEIASLLLMDSDDMVQKGYGWMLKSCSHAYRDDVFRFVYGRRDVIPRTALRYAIEKLPPEMRAEAMKR